MTAMKLARASQAEIDTLMKWLQDREGTEDPPPPYMRVVFGYETLVENCCDPIPTTLEFKPELLAGKTDTKRINWIEHMAAECEGQILTRLFLPDGKPFREKVDAAMQLNPQ